MHTDSYSPLLFPLMLFRCVVVVVVFFFLFIFYFYTAKIPAVQSMLKANSFNVSQEKNLRSNKSKKQKKKHKSISKKFPFESNFIYLFIRSGKLVYSKANTNNNNKNLSKMCIYAKWYEGDYSRTHTPSTSLYTKLRLECEQERPNDNHHSFKLVIVVLLLLLMLVLLLFVCLWCRRRRGWWWWWWLYM